MDDKKPTSVPYHPKRREAYRHIAAPRLEGVVKNAGIKPVRKHKKLMSPTSVWGA